MKQIFFPLYLLQPNIKLFNVIYTILPCTNYWVTKGTEELQFIVDEDYDEHDVHVSVDEATDIAIEQSTTNQTQYLLKLNEKLREKLTPIFNRKHYSSLPQPTINYFEHRSRKNSYNYSA